MKYVLAVGLVFPVDLKRLFNIDFLLRNRKCISRIKDARRLLSNFFNCTFIFRPLGIKLRVVQAW